MRTIQHADLNAQLRAKSVSNRRAVDALSKSRAARPTPRNDLLPTLVLSEIDIAQLTMPTRRLRKSDAAHVQEVANAIATLGFCQPILLGRDDIILDGTVRAEAAKSLGMARVPCIRIDHLTETEQRLLRLAINRLGEKGQWELGELKIEFEELIQLDASIEITGFAAPEIDQIILGDDADAIERGDLEPAPDAVAVARPGDVFRLGPHRLICGDARDPAVLERLMAGAAPVRFVLTDVPYNVKIGGHVTGGGHREFAMASGELSPAEFLAFNKEWIAAVVPYLVDGGLFGTFIDWRGYHTIHAAAVALDLEPLNLITWVKTNAGMGSLWRSQHELLPIFRKGDAPHTNNVELGKHGRWRSNVWNYPGASSLGSDARSGLKFHPTVKPAAMLRDALLDVTHRGDVVIDPFAGSGSTIIAAEEVGRVCYAVEIDPLYVDVVVRRFEEVTGIAATLETSGETFAEVAERRRGDTDGHGVVGDTSDSGVDAAAAHCR